LDQTARRNISRSLKQSEETLMNRKTHASDHQLEMLRSIDDLAKAIVATAERATTEPDAKATSRQAATIARQISELVATLAHELTEPVSVQERTR
jgi:signal transduction histidine kinase